jgi:3-hydroxybutyryl-CoA dehydrogenase
VSSESNVEIQGMSHSQRPMAVLGAGLMGHGIAYLFARAGHRVRVHDLSQGALRSLPERIRQICRLCDSDDSLLARIECQKDLGAAVADADLVIEAISEQLALKCQVFGQLEALAPGDAVLASNTSAIPIGAISAGLASRHRIVGAHFWNPPHLVPLVEVIMASEASRPAADFLIDRLRAAGRHPVLVRRDVPGFIGNRLQHALKREAIALVAAGVCDAETVDDVVKFGFGARLAVLGPLEQSDLVGLDLTRQIHDILMPDLDTTPCTHPYLEGLIAKGELGMKTGKGFRHWTPRSAQAVRERLSRFLAQQAAESNKCT